MAAKRLARALLLPMLCVAMYGCASSQSGTDQNKPLNYKANVSQLKSYDRLGSATFVTNFVWWDSAGISRQLHDYYGSPVIVTFWRTTVQSSIQQLHDVSLLAAKYRESGIVFLGIPLEEKAPRQEIFEHVVSAINSNGITMQQIIGSSELASAFGGVDIIPTVLVVTPNEKIAATLTGPQSTTSLESQIQAILPKH